MVAAIIQRFEQALTSFQLIGPDSTAFDGLAVTPFMISVIVDEMETGDWVTDVLETFQMCGITTTSTPDVSMKDLLKAARALANQNNIICQRLNGGRQPS